MIELAPAGPLTWRQLPRAVYTATRAALWALPKSPIFWPLSAFYGVLFAVLVLEVVRDPVLWGLPVGLVVLFGVCVLALTAWMPTAAMVLPWLRCWVSPAGDITVTAWRLGSAYHASNFSAWPIGEDKTGPFLEELCRQADWEQRAIYARAGNQDLYEKIYGPAGFVVVRKGKRPKIVRDPHPPTPTS